MPVLPRAMGAHGRHGRSRLRPEIHPPRARHVHRGRRRRLPAVRLRGAAAARGVKPDAAVAEPLPSTRFGRVMLLAALVLTGLSMRTAITSVGAVLDDLQRVLDAGDTAAGVITPLPVV